MLYLADGTLNACYAAIASAHLSCRELAGGYLSPSYHQKVLQLMMKCCSSLESHHIKDELEPSYDYLHSHSMRPIQRDVSTWQYRLEG